MIALITGAGGFAGTHLVRELARTGWDVVPSAPEAAPGSDVLRLDVTDATAVDGVLAQVRPDAVFHLAGIASVAAAERDRAEAFRVNCIGAVTLLSGVLALRERSGVDPCCLITGSAEQYGAHDTPDIPLGEEMQLRPPTTYAASKCAQETAALQFHRAHGLRVICTRSFTHSGAGHDKAYLLPALVERALALRKSGASVLPIGNTSPVRDYLHVDDVVRAYRLLVERGAGGEVYNVCSGVGRSVGDMAAGILRRVGVDAALERSEALARRTDIPVLVGNNAKLRRATGWLPERTFEDIVEDLILAASN